MGLWTPEEEQLLREKYTTSSWEELITLFGRTRRAIWNRACRLSLSGAGRRPHQYTETSRAVLAEKLAKRPIRFGVGAVQQLYIIEGVLGKFCRACGRFKALEKYGKTRTGVCGRRVDCTTCESRINYERNPEAGVARARKWQKNNPEKTLVTQHRARARRIDRLGDVEIDPADIKKLITDSRRICTYCKRRIRKRERLTLDHVVALARGGRHELGNLVVACWPCNARKRDLPVDRFLKELKLMTEKV